MSLAIQPWLGRGSPGPSKRCTRMFLRARSPGRAGGSRPSARRSACPGCSAAIRLLAAGFRSGRPARDADDHAMPDHHAIHSARVLRLILLGLALGRTAGLAAADWPQFRGPHRDGTWEETGVLESFPRDGLNILWRQPVGGGWASPVVVQGKVYVLDVELTKPSARERLHCFEAKTGRVLWRFAYEEKYAEWSFVPERGAGPTATPIVEGDRIYTVGANGLTHCLDRNTGRVLWTKNIGQEYRVAELSCRPSPLIEGALLIVFTGAKPGASVLALDKQNGKEVWKALEDPVSNSSPLIVTAGGRRQLIVWTDSSLASLDPADGHVFWREPMVTSSNGSVAMPVYEQGRL